MPSRDFTGNSKLINQFALLGCERKAAAKNMRKSFGNSSKVLTGKHKHFKKMNKMTSYRQAHVAR